MVSVELLPEEQEILEEGIDPLTISETWVKASRIETEGWMLESWRQYAPSDSLVEWHYIKHQYIN